MLRRCSNRFQKRTGLCLSKPRPLSVREKETLLRIPFPEAADLSLAAYGNQCKPPCSRDKHRAPRLKIDQAVRLPQSLVAARSVLGSLAGKAFLSLAIDCAPAERCADKQLSKRDPHQPFRDSVDKASWKTTRARHAQCLRES